MISLRNRRATILPSTLTFAILCHAGLASAQTPQGWPFDDKDSGNPASQQAPPPKTAVQLRLEELYKRDGRPLPSYMRTDASQTSVQQAPQQQQPAQQPYQAPSPARLAAPQQVQVQAQVVPPAASHGSISQQLSDYYASQGKTMPSTQSGWNSAETPRQMTNGYSVQAPAQAPAPKPGFFERLWRRDPPASPPQTSIQVSGYAPVAASTPASSAPSTSTQYGSSQMQVSPAPVAPAVVHNQPAVKHYVMTVELGESAPIETIAPPASEHPTASAEPAVVTHAPQKPSSPAPIEPPALLPAPVLKAPVAVSAPPAQPQSPAPAVSVSGVATVRDETPPFDPKSESDADKKTGPYTGLKLQESDDGVTPPSPTRVTTANVNEPAERPHQAPMPAVDVEPSAKPIAQPKIAAQAPVPVHPAVEEQSGTVHVADSTPAAPQAPPAPTQPAAPKMFVERHPATQLPPAPAESNSQMHRIGERIGQHGMKGFCPVALREQRQLVDALPVYSTIYQSKRYYFSSAEAQARFEEAPQKYAPVAGGTDVVVRANSDQVVDGTLDFAVWYKDRLFLFSSPESAEAFSLNPHPYASRYLTGK
jgi:YHS domain-containing protein